jgi:hypothetical protein
MSLVFHITQESVEFAQCSRPAGMILTRGKPASRECGESCREVEVEVGVWG